MFNARTLKTSDGLMEQAVHTADAALQTTQRVANEAMADLSHTLRAANHQVREGMHVATKKTVGYIRHEPVKSMLIAATTGAVLMALALFVSKPRHPR